jgi:hypothetical protein
MRSGSVSLGTPTSIPVAGRRDPAGHRRGHARLDRVEAWSRRTTSSPGSCSDSTIRKCRASSASRAAAMSSIVVSPLGTERSISALLTAGWWRFAGPLFSFRVDYPEDLLAIAAFLTTLLLVCGLTARTHKMAQRRPSIAESARRTDPLAPLERPADGSRDFHSHRRPDFSGLSPEEAAGDG